MVVILKMDTGDAYHLDRNLRTDQVVSMINENRGKNALITFQDNRTPSRPIYLDPDHVISVCDDGHTY